MPFRSCRSDASSAGRTSSCAAWGDRELADLGSSVTEFIVLSHIADAPSPGASQTEIARFSDMGGPALVRHIDRLEADGIVTRRRDTDDRRVVRISLTPAGRRRLTAIRAVIARCDAEMRSVITVEEASVLERSLDKLFAFARTELYGADCTDAAGANTEESTRSLR